MFFYAQLNEQNICTGVSTLSGEVSSPDMVVIPDFDSDYLYRKYENGQWSTEKYEPQTTAPLTDYEQTKTRVDLLENAVNDLVLGGVV